MIVIYGAGIVGANFLEHVNRSDIVVCDSDKKKIGTKINGHIIQDFRTVAKEKSDEIQLVIVTVNVRFFNEIKAFINSLVDTEVIPYNRCVCINENEIINTGSIKEKIRLAPGIYTVEQLIENWDQSSFNQFDRFIYGYGHNRVNKVIHYTEIYERYLRKYKESGKEVRVLEIGVYGGGSLKMWEDYFSPNVMVYGIDINPECIQYEEDKIKIFIGSQSDRDFLRKVKDEIGKIDIIIDDGGHTMEQQIVSFEELFDVLDDEGVYICEDAMTSYWKEFGGGLRNPNSFIEYSKCKVDDMHQHYHSDMSNEKTRIGTNIKSVCFFDAMVVIEKRKPVNRTIHFAMS